MIKIKLYVSPNGVWCENKKGKLEHINDIKLVIEKIKRKSVDIILLREDIFIENIETEDKNVEKIVKEYIYDRFGDRDDILYNYVVKRKNKRKSITIYLINTSSLDQLKDFHSMFRIKSIWPLQIDLMRKVKRAYKNFNMFIEDRDKIYFLHIQNKSLIYTKIINNQTLENMMENSYFKSVKTAVLYGSDEILNFLKQCNLYDKVMKLGEGIDGI